MASLALLRIEIPAYSVGDKLQKFHTGRGLKAVGFTGETFAPAKVIEVKVLDTGTKEGQEAVAEAYVAGEGADMKVHLPAPEKTNPIKILAKLAQMGDEDQDCIIRAFCEGGFKYVALMFAVDAGGDIKTKHFHLDMRSYRFTNEADLPSHEIKYVLECDDGVAGAKIVRIFNVGGCERKRGWTGSPYQEYKAGSLRFEFEVLPKSKGETYNVQKHIVKNTSKSSSPFTPPPHSDEHPARFEGDRAEEAGKHVTVVYTHNQVVPKNIADDVLQNESAQNVFYGLGDKVTPETDGHLAAISHKFEQVVANHVLPAYGRLRANIGRRIDITKLQGDGLRTQAKLLAALSADDELMHAGMLVELVPEKQYFERHPLGTAPFVSRESLQTRSFAFVTGMLDGMPELKLPRWDKEAHGRKAAPVFVSEFNKLASVPNGQWHQRVVGKLMNMFPDATPDDPGFLIRSKHGDAKYPEGYQFKERAIVPLASIVRGNCMHEAGTEPKTITDFVNKPLQYAHFDAPKPKDGSVDYYGLNSQEGLAKIARLRRDWPLQHMLAVPQIEQMVRDVASVQGNPTPSDSDLMLILARDMLKETTDQEIFNRLFVREALNVWTDVTPPEALTPDYLMECWAYGRGADREAKRDDALANTNGIINPGNRLAVMDAHTLSDLDHPEERTDLILKNPRFIDLAVEVKRAYAEDAKFQAAHAEELKTPADIELLKVADTKSNTAAKTLQTNIRFNKHYPKLQQYPSSVLTKSLPKHRWYMAEESKAGDGFLFYLDESPHTATFENVTHPRVSVETRMLIVDILDKDAAAPPASCDVFGFSAGERAEVWSNGRGEWLPGVIQANFLEETQADGYTVPPNTIKVESEAGTKFILKDNIQSELRRTP